MRQWSLFLLSGAISILAGCGGGTTANVHNPPAPATASVSIAFQPAPPASVSVAATAPVTAVVTNDATNSGVDWVVNCPSAGNCGSVSPQHTASGQPTTYSPPAALPSNTQNVTIFAFATADHTKNVNSSFTVSAFAGFLNAGTYILATTGFDINQFQYQFAAAITLDGSGGIVAGGEQTVNFSTTNPTTSTTTYSSVRDTVTGGSYFIGPDGRGSLTITTADTSVGQKGVEGFSLVVLSNTQAFLKSTDNVNVSPFSNQSSSGTMDFQTPGAQLTTGGYALVVRGSNPSNLPLAFGGVLNIAGQNISATGSKFDEVTAAIGMTSSSSVSGSVSSASGTPGIVHISLTTNFGAPATQTFTGYLIDASHLKLIETDGTVGVTAGVAIGQGTLTGGFSTFSGSYTFGVLGQDSSTSAFATLAAAGSFSAGSGSLTNGSIDELQSGWQVQVTDGFSATYTVDPSGRVDTNSSFTFGNSSNGTGPEVVFYLTDTGNPVLVLDADTTPILNSSELGVATGLAYPTTAGATFAGNYGMGFTQNLNLNDGDATGPFCVNGSTIVCPVPSGGTAAVDTLFGTIDESLGFVPLVPTPNLITDGFQPSAVSGRLTGTLSSQNFPTNPLTVAYYLIDSNHGFFVETDGDAHGANPGFLTFGYFAGRTPVCAGCP